MLLGYARVSSTDQNLEIQLEQLTAAGCEKIFSEKKSGKSVEGRTQLDACMKFAREGDTIIVVRLDRFARSMADFCDLIRAMEDKKVGFQCLSPAMDTTGIYGRLTLQVLMAVAEFERSIRAERQAEGIAKAKEKGVYHKKNKRRQERLSAQIGNLKEKAPAMGATEIAKLLKISRNSVYRLAPPHIVWGDLPEPLAKAKSRGDSPLHVEETLELDETAQPSR